MTTKRRIIVFFQKFLFKNRGHFFGQEGEDVIIYNLLKSDCHHDLSNIRYLDVGCGHPIWLSNTYLLYKYGAKGWCIDANASYEFLYRLLRHRDVFLNVCVGDRNRDFVDFYLTRNRDRATTLPSSLISCQNSKIRIWKKKQMPMISLQSFICKHLDDIHIDLLNIDVEGIEFDILKSLDFKKFHPTIICVEVIDFARGKNHQNASAVINYMKQNGYILSCNTIVNLIFIDEIYSTNRRILI